MNALLVKGFRVVVFDKNYNSNNSIKNFDEFIKKSDIIVANRMSDELKPFANKVYTRDLFSRS